MKQHKIDAVSKDSIAREMEIEPGDTLLSINGQEIKDILDYRWHTSEEHLLVELQKPNGDIWELEIEKDSDEDLGLSFAPGTMSEDRHCTNACIFCFVDQQPPGLRESLYKKDDDPYQSFVMGNYITLTNLDSDDLSQIIKYRLSPMRISVHAADTDIRQTMMGNKKAGDLFNILHQFCQAGIKMHFQVVLVKGINDGQHLDNTIKKLLDLGDMAQSLAIVPVGLTKHRQNLYPIERFTPQDAANVIAQINKWQKNIYNMRRSRFVFLADEWYVLASKETPTQDQYEDFPQLDNGVGMMCLFMDEFICELNKKNMSNYANTQKKYIGIITGTAAGTFIKRLTKRFTDLYTAVIIDVYEINNDFYGHSVTVSGLLTGVDIINQLQGKCADLDVLFIPGNAFRAGSNEMLCGTTLEDVTNALGVKVIKCNIDGKEFCQQLLNA